jgi:hypothetical protein
MANNQVDTLQALAVAIHAFDINTKVVKHNDGSKLIPNVAYMRDYFDLDKERVTPDFLISSELQERAENIRTWFDHSITMTLLTRGTVNGFHGDLAQLVRSEKINSNKLGLFAWAPKLYHDQRARDTVRETIAQIAYRSDWIGKERQSITVNFTLLEKRFFKEFGSWTAFGHDDNNNMIRFMTRHEDRCTSGTIVGRVKSHTTEQYHNNGKITTLNFVKAV